MKKKQYIHAGEYYSASLEKRGKKGKKRRVLPFATTWMELEGIMFSEISQPKTNIL